MDLENDTLFESTVSENIPKTEIMLNEISETLCRDHDEVQTVLDMIEATSSAAELQGYTTALWATGAELYPRQWLSQYLNHYPANKAIDQEDEAFLMRFYQLIGEDLYSDELSYQLLLPRETYSLRVRTTEMALWCEGFMFGIGTMLPQEALKRHPELLRVIADILAISQAEEDVDDDPDALEVAEEDFFNLVEYLKVAALSFYTELVMVENVEPEASRDMTS